MSRRLSWRVSCVAVFVCELLRVAHAEGPSPYQLKLAVDLPVLALGTALWAGTSAIGGSAAPPHCGTSTTEPCNVGQVNPFDRLSIGLVDPSMRLGANIVGALPFAFVIVDFFDAGARNWRSWLTDFVVFAEALAWDGAIQDIVRRASRRPRPFLYTDGAYAGERDSAEATYSFYSGHTAFAFTAATFLAYTFHLRHPTSRWRYVVWPVLLSLAAVEPVLRVLAGDHFPTDVLIGAVAGSAIGILVPALHRRAPTLSVTPTVTAERVTVAVGMRF